MEDPLLVLECPVLFRLARRDGLGRHPAPRTNWCSSGLLLGRSRAALFPSFVLYVALSQVVAEAPDPVRPRQFGWLCGGGRRRVLLMDALGQDNDLLRSGAVLCGIVVEVEGFKALGECLRVGEEGLFLVVGDAKLLLGELDAPEVVVDDQGGDGEYVGLEDEHVQSRGVADGRALVGDHEAWVDTISSNQR